MSQRESKQSAVAPLSPEIYLRPLQGRDVEQVKGIEMAWPLLSHWDIEVYYGVAGGRQNAQGLVAIERESDLKERVVGFLVYRITLPDTEILNIAVDPACTRRQIGTQMLHHLEIQVTREGVQNLFLEVRPSNAPARDFYLKEKFMEVGRRKDYYSNPTEDALLMKREFGN
ncbi:MAG: ribosomal protein S18-alanine N-acetyltransferase [Acidobacteriia bacterium]|nr:ribosomal protein S18-alanine N-acetyltransferase [Terriglobia bacterium]